MDIQILGQERMAQSGKSLTDLIQAKSLGRLDLLVRESVQNSLDASLERKPGTCVDVNFITGEFIASKLNEKFKHIAHKLNEKYFHEKYQFVAIRDSNTHGLTGSNNISDDKSKLQSLVYHISKMQSEEGSGGSWGLGKTTFFKIGMGLVIYYSRTFEDEKYKSKLAATLVENQENNPLVDNASYRGISFFGKYEGDTETATVSDITVPITDEFFTKQLLDIFGINLYEGEETGTTVIIPYVDFDELLSEVNPADDESKNYRNPRWTSSIEDYLKISLQRWYSPRLANPHYNGSSLVARINGELLYKYEMEPLFKLLQELYNVSDNPEYSSDFLKRFDYKRSEITSNFVTGRTAGHAAAAYVDISDLNLTNEYYMNAYSYIREYYAPLGSPIVTFTRNAGMFVRFETKSGAWAPKLDVLDENKILICVFKLASDKMLKDGRSLEEYVRSSEKGDHNNWEDHGQCNVIHRISANTGNFLKRAFLIKKDTDFHDRSSLSRLFADVFLPTGIATSESESRYTDEDKEHLPWSSLKRYRGNKTSRKFKSRLDVDSSILQGDIRIVEFNIRMDSASNSAEVYFEADSERGSVNHAEWENDFNTIFPLSIVHLELSDPLENQSGVQAYPNVLNLTENKKIFENFEISLRESGRGAIYGIFIRSEKPGSEFKVRLAIRSKIMSMSFEIKHMSPGGLE